MTFALHFCFVPDGTGRAHASVSHSGGGGANPPAPPLGPAFHGGRKRTLHKEILIWAVFGTQTFGLLGSRPPHPLCKTDHGPTPPLFKAPPDTRRASELRRAIDVQHIGRPGCRARQEPRPGTWSCLSVSAASTQTRVGKHTHTHTHTHIHTHEHSRRCAV